MRQVHSQIGERVELNDLAAAAPQDPTGPRFLVEEIFPSVDGGRYPVKRIAGEPVEVWVDILREGHDVLAGALLWRQENEVEWQRNPLLLDKNDRWHGRFVPPLPGRYLFSIEAWTDRFATWRREFLLKRDAGQDVALEAREGREFLSNLPSDTDPVLAAAGQTFDVKSDVNALLTEQVSAAIAAKTVPADLTRSDPMPLIAERPRARASAWYEMMPRSQSRLPGRHGTFADCIHRLPEIAAMGFDVVYLTPIHPIGHMHRKGPNNTISSNPNDPGSPYAIGAAEGGHDAVHPELGGLDDFRRLVAACRSHGMEVALDFAIQCSPDHPWLRQHPEWFNRRPDGSIRHAENPPKQYQDIVNPDFYCSDRIALWNALRDIVLFWINQGVTIFRVDNPHTKPFPFWEWLIREVQTRNPEVIFLSEAFTRPKIMKGLAKLGFTQSYTYFTWRTSKAEIQTYLAELTGYPEREYFRPNFFPSTPDILPWHLQGGEPWMFKSRLVLAATLSSNYGIYNGFELLEHTPVPGKEEYLNSDKYELKTRDWDRPENIKDYISRVNRLRRDNSALRQTADLRFLAVDNDEVIGFLKESPARDNAVACVIALGGPDPYEFWLHFGDEKIGPERTPVREIVNLVTGERRTLEWGGTRLRIEPGKDPALLFRCLS